MRGGLLLGLVNDVADAAVEGGGPRCPFLRATVFAGQTGHAYILQLIRSNWVDDAMGRLELRRVVEPAARGSLTSTNAWMEVIAVN